MTEPARASADDQPMLEQAAGWFDRISSGSLSEGDRQAFENWRANPAHASAYAEIEAAHATARAFADSNEMLALRQETLSRLLVRKKPGAWRAGSLRFVAGVGSALLLVSLGFMVAQGPFGRTVEPTRGAQQTPTEYRTGIGERLAATLPDGSRITLNTDSRVRIAYSNSERRLVLERGQALFEVARGQPRPFVVLAAGQRITATGTVFDVRIEPGNRVKVALVEGHVLVRADRAGAAETAMRPSEILVAAAPAASTPTGSAQTAATPTITREPEIEQLVSWRTGMLIFQDDSLAEAVAEMNRYVRQPILLQDARLRQLRVSGAFRTGETDTFIEALELSFPVRVVERRTDAIVLASRS